MKRLEIKWTRPVGTTLPDLADAVEFWVRELKPIVRQLDAADHPSPSAAPRTTVIHELQ
jgi:hypothetical protein